MKIYDILILVLIIMNVTMPRTGYILLRAYTFFGSRR